MKDVADPEDNDKNENVILQDEDLVSVGKNKENVLKARKVPIVSFKTLTEDEQETHINDVNSLKGTKIAPKEMQDLKQNISSQDIISSRGKFMRDTLLEFWEA